MGRTAKTKIDVPRPVREITGLLQVGGLAEAHQVELSR